MSNVGCEFIGWGCFKASTSRVSPKEPARDSMSYLTCNDHASDAAERIEAEGLTPVITPL